jgi:hypothetical protein
VIHNSTLLLFGGSIGGTRLSNAVFGMPLVTFFAGGGSSASVIHEWK